MSTLVAVVVALIVVAPVAWLWSGAIERQHRSTIEAPNILPSARIVQAIRRREQSRK